MHGCHDQRTYRMSPSGADAQRIDPENNLLSRYNRRRLEVSALLLAGHHANTLGCEPGTPLTC